jgi:hypothetical protein
MSFDRGADDALDTFFDDVRAAAADTPAPVPGAALATLFEDGTMPAAPAARRFAPRRLPTLRIAVAGVVGGLVFGGLGVAGALPGPVQTRVADVVDVVGVHLPDGHESTTTTTVAPTPSTVAGTKPGTRASDNGADHGPSTTVDDHRGQSTDDRGSTDDSHRRSSGSDDPRQGSGSDDRRGSDPSTTTTTVDDSRGRDSGHSGSGSGSGSGSEPRASTDGGPSGVTIPDRSDSGRSSSATTTPDIGDHGGRLSDAIDSHRSPEEPAARA